LLVRIDELNDQIEIKNSTVNSIELDKACLNDKIGENNLEINKLKDQLNEQVFVNFF
jgi:predicted nuclease with TOPRIM domain